MDSPKNKNRPCWFVGSYVSKNDETERFINEGIWETNNPREATQNFVNEIEIGDHIAIKSTFRRKHGLPFDNQGRDMGAMRIKATGVVTENSRSGLTLKVDWTRAEPERDWYFHVGQQTVWKVQAGSWPSDALISFAFEGILQDYEKFLSDPRWSIEKSNELIERFPWISFYESIADRLLQYHHNRKPLIENLRNIAAQSNAFMSLTDRYADGREGPLEDIDPFTTIASFNRGIKLSNRTQIATDLARFLGADMDEAEIVKAIETLHTYGGIPVVSNMNTWFFAFHKIRQPNDIDTLWSVFAEALKFADSGNDEDRSSFSKAYDDAMSCQQVGNNLSMGLYWIRPRSFQTLDHYSREYLENELSIPIQGNGPKGRCDATDYLALLNQLEIKFQDDGFPIHSFPELSVAAWQHESESLESEPPPPESENKATIRRHPLNMILYGPPGTGKTYATARYCVEICDRQASGSVKEIRTRYAELVEEERIEFITFHQSYGYEEFVEGLRPETAHTEPGGQTSPGFRLVAKDGVLKRIAERARSADNPVPHVLVIDEINRANVSKVLGELVTLLEEDKRQGAENEISVELPYSGKHFSLPSNLYILGTMNTADRSIALLDTALRRRFEFVELPPDSTKLDAVAKMTNINLPKVLEAMNERLEWLINRDHQIGHAWLMNIETREDVDQIMRDKIIPLIAEYFYDDWKKVRAVLGGTDDFVESKPLTPPPGLDDETSEERHRWTVRQHFSADAYAKLISSSPPTKESPED